MLDYNTFIAQVRQYIMPQIVIFMWGAVATVDTFSQVFPISIVIVMLM